MSKTPHDEQKEENRALGAVLGWLNLSPTLPNNADGISASPPRFISYNQLMEANRNAENLQLAHEIVFNKDFQLKLPEYEKGRSVPREKTTTMKKNLFSLFSIAEKVHDTMHNAFWDVLREDLAADPPRFEHVVNLIGEAKEVRRSIVSFQNIFLFVVVIFERI